MSSMYLYCAFQSSDEFSALETSSIAISFLRGSVRSTCPPDDGEVGGVVVGGVVVGGSVVGGSSVGDAVGSGEPGSDDDGDGVLPSDPKTWNSYSEYPYDVPRFVPSTRTNRPLPDSPVRSSVAPLPVPVE